MLCSYRPSPHAADATNKAMTDSVLRLAAQIYAPFDERESRRLRQYVAGVEELVASAFFQPGEQTLTLSADLGGQLKSTLVYPGEEAVRAVVGLFRQLYNRQEPTSYNAAGERAAEGLGPTPREPQPPLRPEEPARSAIRVTRRGS